MAPLPTERRNLLARTIIAARREAEAGARQALDSLAVGHHEPFGSMSSEERTFRKRLRAHGRQLGDVRGGQKGTQSIDHLVKEVAYEHWHRMLFARFLTENDLLIEPEEQVSISMAECEGLAREMGENPRDLAARFAQDALPQIFRSGDPVLEVTLAPETRQALNKLLDALPATVFTADDSLGWTYQYWQTEQKEAVNKSGEKIGAKELPAVTQLFTEDYMVAFLLDNSLGAWWAARKLSADDLANTGSEDELRRSAAIPGVPLDYLRFVRQESGAWTPAAGVFANWPDALAELKAMDPCCGSGHFLVAALLMLVPMRMELEELSAAKAVDAVLRENIHGLELDQRCVELAAFALALAAWKYPGAGGYRPLPELHVACSGLYVSAAKDEWKQLGIGDRQLANALAAMHGVFQDAPVLGSLLDPAATEAAKLLPWDELSVALDQLLQRESGGERREAAVVAQGLARAATLLSGRYHWVITNVPYLKRGKQGESLRDFCLKKYPAAKNDLATVFLDRCLELCVAGGTVSIVLPQNWLFLTSYKKFRERLLEDETWHLIARLGAGAFETISGEVVKAILLTLSRGQAIVQHGGLFVGELFDQAKGRNLICGVDVSEQRTAAVKAIKLVEAEVKSVEQTGQLENPDARVALGESFAASLLEKYTTNHQGLSTGDNPRFRRAHWEVANLGDMWVPEQSTVDGSNLYGGRSGILLWEEGRGQLWQFGRENVKALHNVDRRGEGAWGKHGVGISQMRTLPATFYSGVQFDTNVSAIVPQDPAHLPAIWSFCSSPEYNQAVRRIDQKLNVTNATLVKVPFDLDHWTKVAEERYPNGLPKPYTNDPTQWIFHGHPCGSVIWDEEAKWTAQGPFRTDGNVLQIAVARLLGYRWPAEVDASMELAEEQRSWVNRCETLLPFADEDGIVCLSATRGERSATDRLRALLAAAYGKDWSAARERELLAAEADNGKPSPASLDIWLRDHFFERHCKLFHHRPFIWHIWDGNRSGFHCLVNAHLLTAPDGNGRRTLEAITYSYLGNWIERQHAAQKEGEDGADARLAAAQDLKEQLEKILEGETPHDLFIRWKALHEQALGWEPDINDGVRLNIRPFMQAELRKGGKKGAGILRWKPTRINWKKDRGNEPESLRPKTDYPWFWGCTDDGSPDDRSNFTDTGKFDGKRWNDLHYSLAVKQAARKAKAVTS